jgi:hypothetical protein
LLVADKPETAETPAEKTAAVAQAPAAEKAQPAKTAVQTAALTAPSLAPKQPQLVAGSVRYGMAGRSELMGRGAGPVYNLKGNGPRGQSGDVDTLIKQVGTMVEGAQQQIDSSTMDEKAKAKLKQDVQGAVSNVPAQ